jgi:hypothetical protein
MMRPRVRIRGLTTRDRLQPVYSMTVPPWSSVAERADIVAQLSSMGDSIVTVGDRYHVEMLLPKRFRSRFQQRH